MIECFLDSSVLLLMELFFDFDTPIILKTMIHKKKINGVGVKFCDCATILSEVLKLCNDLLLICYLLSEVLQLCKDLLFVRTKKYKILTV